MQSPKTDDPLLDCAFWDVPGSSIKVIYPLPLFHEIDFAVNEGYRKIPHGGIEVGALLFGSVNGETVRIEAFRAIHCEHASGPSFILSERDLSDLEKQIASSGSDPELAALRPIGWFLAHTRGSLELTESEAKHFDRFFPGPFRLTVLVKPERYQPTRFRFLVRQTDGGLPREATWQALILPLPGGRSIKPGQLTASIPAPAQSGIAQQGPAGSSKNSPHDESEKEDETEERFPAAPPPDSRTAEERSARRQLARDRARVMEQSFASTPAPSAFGQMEPAAGDPVADYQPAYSAIGFPPAEFPPTEIPPPEELPVEHVPAVAVARASPGRTGLNSRSLTTLALAALLGCLVGYIGYLQLPAPVIPLDVRAVNETIVVSWPANQTRNSIYAAIRFNDGAPVPLSSQEKTSGHVSLAASTDFKVEVIARNWARDSRGMVRYLHSANGEGKSLP